MIRVLDRASAHAPASGRTRAARLAAGAAALIALAACGASQAPAVIAHQLGPGPGFWLGVWHGLIVPIDFLVGLFSDHIRVYAVPNAGRWYDFGFMIGIGGFHGGLFAGGRRRPPRKSGDT